MPQLREAATRQRIPPVLVARPDSLGTPAGWLGRKVFNVLASDEQPACNLQRFQTLSFDELGDGLAGDPPKARRLRLRNPLVEWAFRTMS
jgi:hypothetical protein